MKTSAEIKFDAARKKLSDAFKNLEEAIEHKLQDGALESKLIEQEITIQNLNSQINILQKNFVEISGKADFLDMSNKNLSEKFFALKKQGSDLVQNIELDLIKIEEIINEE